MARFYASIQGNRGQATRMGHESSGIRGHIRGWSVGVRVIGAVDAEGEDVFHVFKTGGSGGYTSDEPIAVVKREPTD